MDAGVVYKKAKCVKKLPQNFLKKRKQFVRTEEKINH